MSKSTLVIDTPETCGDCPFCICTKEEKKYIGYCNTSDDYYCKALDRFMEYDNVDGGVDILGKPIDCPLQAESKEVDKITLKSKQLIDELSKMPPMVIATAYLHALNYIRYGEDVTEKWLTAVQNASALEKAYRDGYYYALDRLSGEFKKSESEDKDE